MMDAGKKFSADMIEKQKELIKIPDLKDVHVDEAMRVLKEIRLTPTKAIAHPNVAYADESEHEVMYSEPRFGLRVSPGTSVKIYYLTQDIIDKSKILFDKVLQEFKTPDVIGANVYEARALLESKGLVAKEKLEKPGEHLAQKEDGQVTRLTLPSGKKVTSKLSAGDLVYLYYVNEEVLLASKSIQLKNQQDQQEKLRIITLGIKDVPKDLYTGVKSAVVNLTKSLDKDITNSEKE